MVPLPLRTARLASGALLIGTLIAIASSASAMATPDSPTTRARIDAAKTPTVQASRAGVQSYQTIIQTTVDPYSPIQSSMFKEKGKNYWTTTSKDSATVDCYEQGTRNDDGYHRTNVWYHLTYIKDPAHGTLNDAWTWGGNVNVEPDPPAGLPSC